MKIDTNKYTKELENTLKALSSGISRESAERAGQYMSTKLYMHGLGTKTQVELSKKGFRFHSENAEETFSIYDAVFCNPHSTFEAKNMAFLFLDKHYKHIPLKLQLNLLPGWVKHVENWGHSDNLSKFLSRLIEHPETKEKMLSHIEKWNRSKNLWERRQSLVTLFYYARTRKQHLPFDLVIRLIGNLLHDKEYFVQKAVGWTLRESYNVYPKDTYKFLMEHIGVLSPYAFTASTEKMNEKEKTVLKDKRQKEKGLKRLKGT
ncbi:MAG: DNA alkylation repair protein [Bacteroidota bacterium]